MNPISIRLSRSNHIFLERFARQGKLNKTDLINQALDELRKKRLSDELNTIALRDVEGDREMAEKGMKDYFEFLKRHEAA